MRLRELAKYLGGLALAGLLLWWVFRDTDPASVRDHVKTLPVGFLVAGLLLSAVLNVSHNVFRVWRWRALLEPVRPDVPFRPMFDAVILGYLASWTVPGRLGEFVRPALLAGRERLPLGACLGSVLADRVLDGLAVVVLFGLGMLVTPLPAASAAEAQLLRNASLFLVVAIGVPVVVLLLASANRGRLERWLEGRRGVLAWVARTLLAFARGTEALSHPKLLVRVILHTAGAWLLIVISTWIGIRAAGVEISPSAVAVILPLLVLGIALPTPGGAGGYHLAMKVGLVRFFGVAEPAAIAAGLLVHLSIVVPIILLGTVLLVVDRIPLRELMQGARQIKSMGHAEPEVAPRRRTS